MKLTSLFKKKKKKDVQQDSSKLNTQQDVKMFESLDENVSFIKQTFSDSDDLVSKKIQIRDLHGVLIYLDTMTDQEKIQKNILKPMMESTSDLLEDVLSSTFRSSDHLNKVHSELLNGACLIFLDGAKEFYITVVSLSKDRSVDEPSNEQVISGSHEGFVENHLTNLHLIRKALKTPALRLEHMTAGDQVPSKLTLVYREDLANKEIIEELKLRIEHSSIDHIPSFGFLQELIEDSTWSPFPQILYTERVDRVAAHLNEGRISVFIEGNPSCFIVPVTFFAFFHSPDDYNSRWMIGSFVRSLRLLSIAIAVNLPAIYIAVIGFHFEVLPDELVLPVITSIRNIPFPPLVEALVMELTIELIREAGVRLPSRIGQTIGIVGGLVIGDAVVRAGLISNTMIVVVAITAVAAYSIPTTPMSDAVRFLRFPLMVLSSTFGFVGIVIGTIFILAHLCRLESFGTPYFAPWAPFQLKDIKDTFIRLPLLTFNTRPEATRAKYLKKQSIAREWKVNERRHK
jgi:spore germination protein KA